MRVSSTRRVGSRQPGIAKRTPGQRSPTRSVNPGGVEPAEPGRQIAVVIAHPSSPRNRNRNRHRFRRPFDADADSASVHGVRFVIRDPAHHSLFNPFRVGGNFFGIQPGVASHPGLRLLNPAGVGMEPAVLDGFTRLSIPFQGRFQDAPSIGLRCRRLDGGESGGVDVAQGDAGLGGDGSAGFVFGRCLHHLAAQSPELHLHQAMRRAHRHDLTLELASVGPGASDTECAGLGEQQFGQGIGIGVVAEHGEQDPGPVLLHLDRGVEGIECAESEGLLQDMTEDLRVEVVDVGFEEGDAVGFPIGSSAGPGGFPEDGAEDVGTRAVIAGAEAVSDPCADHALHGAEGFGEFGEESGSGWGDHFVGFVALGDRDAAGAEDFEGGGGGQRELSVGASDESGSLDDVAGGDPGPAEEVEGDAGADDVDDGIDGTDFVELDAFGWDTVDASFGDGDALEDGEGAGADPLGEGTGLDQVTDGGVIASVGVTVIVTVVV
jgi:hypothetical protein